jgi:subtilase family serine protease
MEIKDNLPEPQMTMSIVWVQVRRAQVYRGCKWVSEGASGCPSGCGCVEGTSYNDVRRLGMGVLRV